MSIDVLVSRCGENVRMAGYFLPDTPTIDNFPTFPRLLKSNIVRPTTPTFLSDPEAPPPTNPVVYSPVPTMRTFSGLEPSAPFGWLAISAMLKMLQLCLQIDLEVGESTCIDCCDGGRSCRVLCIGSHREICPSLILRLCWSFLGCSGL